MKDGSGKFSCDCECHTKGFGILQGAPGMNLCCEGCYQNHGISLRAWKNSVHIVVEDVRKDGIQPSN